jgi:hypothetical protein
MSSPELQRHFASLFWTPKQAKRIAKKEQPTAEKRGMFEFFL